MSKGTETRGAVLDCATEMASRIGLEGLSIGELAKKAGLSKSGLFAHFDSKQNLQMEVLERSVERFIARVVAPALKKPRGLPRVIAIFENWLRWSKDLPGGCIFIAAANELDDRPGPLRDRLVGYQNDWVETLTTAARIAVSEGHFAGRVDPQQFAYDFYSILLAYHHFSRLVRDPKAEARARKAFDRLIATSRSAPA